MVSRVEEELERIVRMPLSEAMSERKPLVMPNGELTTEYTPEVERMIETEVKTYLRSLKSESQKLLDLIDKTRQRIGSKRVNKAMGLVEQIKAWYVEKDGEIQKARVGLGELGPDGKLVKLNPVMPLREVKIFDAFVDFGLIKPYLRGHYCPTSFALEPGQIDFSNLGKLLEKEYVPNESDLRYLESKGYAKKMRNETHKFVAKYFPGMDEEGFNVVAKLTGLGLSGPKGRDKYDLVVRVGENGKLTDYYHIEARLPETSRIIAPEQEEIIGLAEELTPDIMDTILRQHKGFFGYQVKTDRANREVFGNSFLENGKGKRNSYGSMERIANYDQLLRDPALAGGHALGEVVAHIAENMGVLKGIYERQAA